MPELPTRSPLASTLPLDPSDIRAIEAELMCQIYDARRLARRRLLGLDPPPRPRRRALALWERRHDGPTDEAARVGCDHPEGALTSNDDVIVCTRCGRSEPNRVDGVEFVGTVGQFLAEAPA